MKKFFVFLFLCLSFGVHAQQFPNGGVVIVTFFPVYEQEKKLVAVELVGASEKEQRFKDLEREVMRNDWRPLLPGSIRYNPGKCTVVVYKTIFDVDCWLVFDNQFGERRVETKVATVTEVINFVKHFSSYRKKM